MEQQKKQYNHRKHYGSYNDTAEPSINKTTYLITETITDPCTDQTTNEISDKTTEITQDRIRKQP